MNTMDFSSSGISLSSSGEKRKLTISSSSIDHEVINSFSEFQREAWLMSGINSPYLVNLEGIVMDPLCLVMEFLPFGALYDVIHHPEKFPE
jgi:serine/threonine protein kinase